MKTKYKIDYRVVGVKEWSEWVKETGQIFYDNYDDVVDYYDLLMSKEGSPFEYRVVMRSEEVLVPRKKRQYAEIGFGEGDHPDYKEEQPVKSSWDARGDDWYL